MIKLIVPLLNLIVILALQIFQGDVSVKMEVPPEVNAGSEFEVKITLNKGELEGFSRFQQSIPAGLTAQSGTSSSADFSFSEKRVRLIWLRTPQPEEITVTYRVKVDERLKGTFSLSGKFSYIDNNERKSVDIDPVAVTIIPSSEIDPSLIVDVNDYEKMALPYAQPGAAEALNIACIRQKPFTGPGGEYIVNVLVNKESTQKFAKIEEDVPDGFTAVALDAKDAIFTFKDQRVKFLWMNLPMEKYFTVSYRLIPRNQAKLDAPVISGAFSYLVEDKTVSVRVVEKDLDLASLGAEEIQTLVAEALREPAPDLLSDPVTDDVAVADNNKQVPPSEEPDVADEKPVNPGMEAYASQMLGTEQGVYFRIQLAAGHKPVDIDNYFSKLKLEKEIRKETHDGWQKYSVGSFIVYKEARDYRVHIWNTTPVKDAFVTAYNSGQRITVQEALMVTEQKWIR
ncbi:MAG TPA: hypothetical protein VJ203_07005 [Bacteroidales bacterium]|nr:hypothetical protein [Bacteroidales bacterium]